MRKLFCVWCVNNKYLLFIFTWRQEKFFVKKKEDKKRDEVWSVLPCLVLNILHKITFTWTRPLINQIHFLHMFLLFKELNYISFKHKWYNYFNPIPCFTLVVRIRFNSRGFFCTQFQFILISFVKWSKNKV